MDLFYKNLKLSLGLAKSTNREKINFFLNIKDPTEVMRNTIKRLHLKAPQQIPELNETETKKEFSNLRIDSDAIILTLLNNYNWLAYLGFKCNCGKFKISSLDSLNCESLKNKSADKGLLPLLKETLKEKCEEKITKILNHKDTNSIIESLVTMQKQALNKYTISIKEKKRTLEGKTNKIPKKTRL